MTTYNITLDTPESVLTVNSEVDTLLIKVIISLELPIKEACKNGVCGLCRCRLVSGSISYKSREPFGLWEKELEQGYILPCIAYATSDLRLDNIPLEGHPPPTNPKA